MNALSHRARVAKGRVRVSSTTSACESPILIRPAATFSRWEKDCRRRGDKSLQQIIFNLTAIDSR